MNPLDPHNQLEEHIRDSAPDNSRFDGFDRGDLGRPDEPYEADLSKIEARLAAAGIETARNSTLRRGKSVALAMLASIGAFGSKLQAAVAPPMSDLFHAQRTDGNRRLQRDELKRLGRRQYRRKTCTSYALKRAATR